MNKQTVKVVKSGGIENTIVDFYYTEIIISVYPLFCPRAYKFAFRNIIWIKEILGTGKVISADASSLLKCCCF